MSYIALITEKFDEMVLFYGTDLGFPTVDSWDRPNGRGQRFDLGGMRLELLDNARERKPLPLGEPADRFHVVVEVDDIEQARSRIKLDAPPAKETSWGACMFQIRDPDGVPVTFLQWIRASKSIHGRLEAGLGGGKQFTQLEWARKQFIDKLGIDPFPGTINLVIDDPESMAVWGRLKDSTGVAIENPGGGSSDCNGRCYPVSIGGRIDAAIVLPEVPDYPTDKIEVIAAVAVREALGIDVGASLVLEIKDAEKGDTP